MSKDDSVQMGIDLFASATFEEGREDETPIVVDVSEWKGPQPFTYDPANPPPIEPRYCLYFINRDNHMKDHRVWLEDGTTYEEAMESGVGHLANHPHLMFEVEKYYALG